MAKRYQITIEKKDETYIIHRNKHLNYLIEECRKCYKTIVDNIEFYSQTKYQESDDFIKLMTKVLDEKNDVYLSGKELTTLGTWIDINVILFVELDNSNLQDKEVKKFLKIAENFINEIKNITNTLIPTYYGIDTPDS